MAALTAIALLLAACGSRVRDWPDDAAAPVAVDDASVRTTIADGPRDEPRAGMTSTTTSRSNASPTTSAATVRGAIPAPVDGVYFYDVVTSFPAYEDEPAETLKSALRVTWRSTRAAGVVISETRQADVEDDTSAYTSSYRTTSASLELLKTVVADEEGDTTCAYSPPQVLLQLPLRVGVKWHSDSSCRDGDYVEKFALDGEVVSTGTDTVGGKTVKTFVVKYVENYTETDTTDPDPDNVLSSRTELTTHVDSTTLLVITEEVRNVEDGYAYTSRRSLRSIEPRSA